MAFGTTTDLNIKVDATTASAEAGLARLTRSTRSYEAQLRRTQLAAAALDRELEQQAAKKYADQTKALEVAGRSLMIFGGVTAVGLGLSAKAAIDWETAWAGVRKTVSGSDAELAAIENGLRDLAKTLPTSHAEIAAVAEAAGQLGVKGKDIVSFTKTMIDLAQTTNLTADEAATSMARFSNIMQTPTDQVDRLGASLVALGNDGASTEADILAMSVRIAAAGNLVGLTEGEVLGLANAMSSLGLEAEAGGSAISLTLRQVSSAVAEGGDSLMAFAELAGMSADQFGRLFTTDAAAGTEALVKGLARIKNEGGDVNATLAGLGITGIRQVDTLLRLAQSGNLLSDSLDLGNRAFEENTALLDEANKRYETTASKIQVAKNQVVDFGIELGDRLLPILGSTVGVLSDIIGAFDSLPGPLKDSIVVLGVAAAAVGLLGGAALTTVAKVRTMKVELADARTAFGEMNKGAAAARAGALALAVALPTLLSATGNTSEGMQDLTTIVSLAAAGFAVGGPWGAAIGGAAGVLSTMTGGSNDAAEAQQRLQGHIEAVSVTLHEQTGAVTKNTEAWVREQLATDDFVGTSRSAFDSAEQLGISLGLVQAAALGNDAAFEQLNGKLRELGEGKGFGDKVTYEVLNLRKAVDESRNSIEGSQQAARQSREAHDDLGTSYKGTGNKAEDAAQAIRELTKAEKAAAEAAIQNKRDQLALISTMQSAREEARRGKRTLDENTKAGQENWAALLDLADQWESSTPKVRNADGAYKDVRRTFIEVAREMGASEEKAKKLADRFLSVPPAAQKASKAGKDMAVDIGESLRGIQDEPVNVTLSARANKVLNQLELNQGGEIPGVDMGRDSVPAVLRPGEHVFTVSDVRKAGGQEAMYSLRRMIQRGEFAKRGDLTPFRAGGAVVNPRMRLRGLDTAAGAVETWFDSFTDTLSEAVSGFLSKKLTHLPTAGALGPGGTLTPAQLLRGQEFARSQAGKPYSWGGVGPGGYDCSGAQSATLNAAMGRYPYSRIGSTGTMPWPGSSPGVGRYTMGWSTNVGGSGIGHTSGNIGGLGIESSGDVGFHVGSSARSPMDSMFYGLQHYDSGGILRSGGYTLAGNFTGHNEYVGFAEGGEVKKKPPSPRPVTEQSIAETIAIIRDAFGKRSPLVDIIQQWLEGLKRGELTQKAFNQRVDKALHHLVGPALRQFNIGPRQTVSESRGELQELLGALKETFGKDSPIVSRVERLGDRLLEVQKRQDKVAAAYERANDKLQMIMDRQGQFMSEVRSAFTHDAFGSEISSRQQSLLQIRADANDAERAARQFRRLGRKGLDDSIIRELAASGNTALLQSLSGSSRKEINAFERAFRRRNQALGQLGQLTGRQVFGDEIRKQTQVVQRLDRRLERLDHTLNRLENRVERGAEKGVRRGMGDRERVQRAKRRAGANR